MRNYTYFIGFFLVLCSLALLEFLVAPPLLYEGDENLYESHTTNLSVDVQQNALEANDFLEDFLSVGMQKISISTPAETDHLFFFSAIDSEKDSLRVLKTDYLQENEIKDIKKILVGYEVFSTKPRTIISAYEYLKGRMKEDFSTSVESRIVEDNRYGDKSFTIRLEEGQKTMYIVAAHRDRLLGFEYPLDSLGSRHEDIEKVLEKIFSE